MSAFAGACAVAALAGSTGGAVASVSAQPVSGAQRITHDTLLTTNWAGYSVHRDGTTFSDVQGDWTQPSASCSGRKTTFAAFFVGIDGAITSSTSVEQIGTEADCVSGSPVYFAWYEMYPDPPVRISDTACAIAPNQTITGHVHFDGVSNGVSSFDVSLTLNGSTSPCFTTTVDAPGTPDRSTAEWIAEAPATGGHIWPLTNFGQVNFANALTTGTDTTSHTETGNISDATSWDPDTIEMVAHGNPFNPTYKAQPDPNTFTGSSFTVDWVSSS